MYIPAPFAESDVTRLHEFIERNSFGVLVTQMNGEPFASHLPMLLERHSGPHGCLIGHMARANPQWRDSVGQNVLAIFAGPHAYVSPTWYEADNVVPTWNYVAVHAYGTLHIVEEPALLLKIVTDFVTVYESSMPKPWTLNGPPDFVERLLRQIVGFRIDIARIEGKWKLNQNQPAERRQKVALALREQTDDNSQAIAALMAKNQV